MASGTPDWWKRAEAFLMIDFLGLIDVPGSYAGKKGTVPEVTVLEDGLEFSDTVIDDHSARHESGGADEIDLTGMTPTDHAARHEAFGDDEIDVTDLFGILFDEQNSSWALVSGKPATFTPSLHAAEHEPGGGDEMEVDAAVGTGSLRTLGAGAQQAAPGNDGRFGTVADNSVTNVKLAPTLAGNELVGWARTERYKQADATWTKVKEIRISQRGTNRIKFDLKCFNLTYYTQARIYRNGAPVGTIQNATVPYTTRSEDIAGWGIGDLCQLYYSTRVSSESYQIWVKNFEVFIDYARFYTAQID